MEFKEVREVSSTSAAWEIDNDNLYRQSPIPLYGLFADMAGKSVAWRQRTQFDHVSRFGPYGKPVTSARAYARRRA